jgi:hypothetical protein
MNLMSPRAATLILLSVWALSGAAFAQGEEDEAARIRAAQQEAQRQAAERRASEEDKQQRERGTRALNDFLIDGHTQMSSVTRAAEARREVEQKLQLNRFHIALEEFDTAREELSEALGFKAKLKDPARKMEKSIAGLLDFIKRTSKESQRFNPSEFKDFKPMELGWEALTSAERISPDLAAVLLSGSETTVDIRFLLSLSKLQSELLRLQWMTQRLK